MKKIYSKITPNLLLGIITDLTDFDKPRNELIEPDNFLQGALIRVNAGDSFRPHRHLDKEVTFKTTKAQECWVVVKGTIKCSFYDLDDSLLEQVNIREGGLCINLHGGHTFECLEDFTFVAELKSGPYFGQAKDKIFIDT